MTRLEWNPRKRGHLRMFSPMAHDPHSKRRKLKHNRIIRFAMEGESPAQRESQKINKYEARLIPGIDGNTIFGFPNSIITKIRYCDQIVITSTLGVLGTYLFAANSIFDPDQTGIGHQPLFRDNFANIYNYYVVLGSKITCTFLSDTPAQTPWIVGITGDDNGTSSTVLATRMELNNSVSRLMPPYGSGDAVQTLEMTYEPNRNLGVNAEGDGTARTAVGSDPTDVWYYSLFAATLNASTLGCYVKVEIDYTVKFSELVSQTQN